MDYKKGYEQYKGKCERLEKRITEMEEKHEGWMEALKANDAIVAGVLVTVGADKDHPVRVDKGTISEALAGKYLALVQVKEEDADGRWLFFELAPGAEDEQR